MRNAYEHRELTEATKILMHKLREKFSELHDMIDKINPSNREKALALTNLEQAAMWANKAVIVCTNS